MFRVSWHCGVVPSCSQIRELECTLSAGGWPAAPSAGRTWWRLDTPMPSVATAVTSNSRLSACTTTDTWPECVTGPRGMCMILSYLHVCYKLLWQCLTAPFAHVIAPQWYHSSVLSSLTHLHTKLHNNTRWFLLQHWHLHHILLLCRNLSGLKSRLHMCVSHVLKHSTNTAKPIN